MVHKIYCQMSASVDEIKGDPLEVLAAGGGDAVLVFANDEPAFYCVPPGVFRSLQESYLKAPARASVGASGSDSGLLEG